jgi:hypothetical protein
MVFEDFDNGQTLFDEFLNPYEETMSLSPVRTTASTSDNSSNSSNSSAHEDSVSFGLEAVSSPYPQNVATPPPPDMMSSPDKQVLFPHPGADYVLSESESESDSDSDFVDSDHEKRAKRRSNNVAEKVKREDESAGKTSGRKRSSDVTDSRVNRSPKRRRGQKITTVTNLDVNPSSLEPEAVNDGGASGSSVVANNAPHQSQGPRVPKSFPCIHIGCPQICKSAGDLKRHLESRQHKVPSYHCRGCDVVTYTRIDALRRHHKNKPDCAARHRSQMAKQEND